MIDLPDEPEFPYVFGTDDKWAVQSNQVAGCWQTGPILFSPAKGLEVTPQPCHSHKCKDCGPKRCQQILKVMGGYFDAEDSVWLCRVTPSSAHSPAEQKREVRARARTITNAISDRGGDHLSIDTSHDGLIERHIFANVDHSTKRRNRGNPPRVCDQLTPADALDYLNRLLRNGILSRRGSKGWKLPDGERATRGISDRTSIGFGTERRRDQIEQEARDMYDREGGTDWPRHRAYPNNYPPAKAAEMFWLADAQLIRKPANVGSL